MASRAIALPSRPGRRIGGAIGAALGLVLAAPASAQADATPAPTSAPTPTSTATPTSTPAPPPSFASSGPWTFSGAVTADIIGVPAGGIAPGLKLLTKTAVSASYDGNSASLPGWSGQLTVQLVHGGHPSAANIGDAQGADNIEAPGALRLYEAWIARQWSDGHYGVKFGLTDLNVDFDTQQVAALFLNSGDGVGSEFGHSGLNGPSIYPAPALAVSGFAKPSDNWTLRAGVFDGVAGSPDHPYAFVAIRSPANAGLLLVAQVERQFAGGVRAELGGWTYTAGFDALHQLDAAGNPLRLKRDRGLYALIEGPLVVGERTSLSGWVRAGIGDPAVQRISGYLGGGLVASGLFPSRKEDQAGIAVNHAVVDDPTLPPTVPGHARAETAIELTYKAQLRDWLAVQPDAQVILHPGGDPTIPDALVVGLRLSVALTRNLVRQVSSAP